MSWPRTVLGGALSALLLPVLSACGPADAQVQQNILVDPAGGAKPGYTTVARLADVPFASLGPGSSVLVRGGSYGDVVFVGSRGTAAAPVTVAAEPGTQPRLSNSVVFENATYVTVTGLSVQGAVNSGFIIRRGSSHVTVAGSTVSRSGLGIWIGDGAGAGHRITGNTLADNQTHGVAVDVINAPAEDPSFILDNTVTGNGIHGMEINGSGYVVEGNRVSGNGVGMSGTSGIHVYAKDAAQDAGDRNIIRYNIVTGQKETTGQDGNGIQIDQWCDGNIVAFNVAADNDGAGINLFDAGSNTVVNNSTTGNMRDSGGKHVYRGEIVLASDYTKQVDRTSNNRVLNNIAYATRPNVAAIVVEATTTDNNNAIGPNFLGSAVGAPLYRWGTQATGDGASLPLNGQGPDLTGTPAFRDPANPMAGGLALTAPPARAGIPLGATRDIAGQAYAPGEAPTFGAYRNP
ncbi:MULTISPECIES: right-handed parallel beta-helix repeat-containing protein [Methylobacterium]|uniref:right-handed parallel beta-helix repeat-containing protein n=1 Tax=Methylobacterium TaxID=407 RepID=UPI00037AF77B|nr:MULTISPECIES: right-handed parallel beta-helix repeat-containing protein [Methylobacterium]MBN4096847.1 right-handed parallel beta-helix repeat-containing protein [Methylobacterium sp. OT2]UIN36145.1 right-handed parallel beta-helix repeat-containing protein [Methylobacterium oryzae]